MEDFGRTGHPTHFLASFSSREKEQRWRLPRFLSDSKLKLGTTRQRVICKRLCPPDRWIVPWGLIDANVPVSHLLKVITLINNDRDFRVIPSCVLEH